MNRLTLRAAWYATAITIGLLLIIISIIFLAIYFPLQLCVGYCLVMAILLLIALWIVQFNYFKSLGGDV